MTRFESSTFPDRFSLEAAARRHRSEGIGKVFDATATWMESHLHGLTRGIGSFSNPTAVHLHRPSPR